MESQISSLFSSILTTIKDYEDRTNKQIRKKHDTIIQEKDQQIQVLNDLKQKQQNEMEDFLKVSYATRWKNAAEEFEKNVHLQDKIESLTRTNEKLNSKLDSLTELVSEETQTDCNEEKVVTIKTKKGAIYILQNGQLLKDNKLVGEVVINE